MAIRPSTPVDTRRVTGGVIAIVIGAIATIVQFDEFGAAFDDGLRQVLHAAWPLILIAVGVVLVVLGLLAGDRGA